MSSVEARKQAAAMAAVAEIQDDMLIGLGTGSTAAFVVQGLAARVRGGLRVEAVATSVHTATAAEKSGIRVLDFADVARVDLCIDGVDEIDPALRAIKGAGGAMLREKIVASAAARMIAVADDSKDVARLGGRPVPVETLPFARAFVARCLREMGGTPVLRVTADGAPYRTDQQNLVLDCDFGPIPDPEALAITLSACPGILGHGLFPTEIDTIYIGTETGVTRRDRKL